MTGPRKLKEHQLIERLEYLADRWPDDYWLFAASGNLCLVEKNANGNRAMNEGARGGVNQNYLIEDFPGIECDGGDW